MKIALFTDVFLPKVDGVIIFTINLAKAMADRGHEVLIIAPKNKRARPFSYHRVKLHRTASIPFSVYEDYKFTLPFDPKIVQLLKKEKIDIVHFQSPLMLGVQAILTSML
ncbi:MAG: glycosyltransferase [Nanoarchaeota archaeon]